jgi:hypothetical protein
VTSRFYDGVAEYGFPRRTVHSHQIRLVRNEEMPAGALTDGPSQVAERGIEKSKVPWPEPRALKLQLSAIKSAAAITWADAVQQSLNRLLVTETYDDPTVQECLSQLSKLATEADAVARSLGSYEDQTMLLGVKYGIERRIELWNSVRAAASQQTEAEILALHQKQDLPHVLALIDSLRRYLDEAPHGPDWIVFLGLDGLQETLQSGRREQTAIVASRIIRQLSTANLSSNQQAFLRTPRLDAFRKALPLLTAERFDMGVLLQHVELLEYTNHPLAQKMVADTWNHLRYSPMETYRNVAKVLDLHYRNANVRFSMTEEFANSFLPAVKHARAPVREQILGADVQGQSTSLTQMHVKFLPDPDEIQMKLEANGVMSAQTESSRGSVTLLNRNKSHFNVQKLFSLDPNDGLHLGRTHASASAKTDLLGMRTRYDTFPLLGTMVRRIARQKHYESKPLATQILKDRIAFRLKQKIDKQLDVQMRAARERIEQNVIRPLHDMELEPEALAMYTTQDRIVLRGRLASSDQMAAFNSRPQALANSLLSIQLHESALNNFLAQMDLGGREVGIRDLVQEILNEWELNSVKIPEDIQNDIQITMTEHQPVRIRCEDNRIRIELSVRKLATEFDRWKNFRVTVHYIPLTDGFSCDLHRDGPVELKSLGKYSLRGSDRFALAAVFTKVFSPNRPIKIINDSLKNDPRMGTLNVEQFVIRDGWVGLSVCPRVGTQISRRPSNLPARPPTYR